MRPYDMIYDPNRSYLRISNWEWGWEMGIGNEDGEWEWMCSFLLYLLVFVRLSFPKQRYVEGSSIFLP